MTKGLTCTKEGLETLLMREAVYRLAGCSEAIVFDMAMREDVHDWGSANLPDFKLSDEQLTEVSVEAAKLKAAHALSASRHRD